MFTFSMEGNNQPTAHRSQVPFAWAPGWNSPQAWNKFQDEVGGKLRFGDPGVRLFETSENSLDYFTSVPARFQPQGREMAYRAITTTCLAAMNCHSVLRSSRAVCRSRTSNSTQRMPRSWG